MSASIVRLTLLAVLVPLLAWVAPAAVAASDETYRIGGRVVDTEGDVVTGHDVTAFRFFDGEWRTAGTLQTSSTGEFRFDLAPGQYRFRVDSERSSYPTRRYYYPSWYDDLDDPDDAAGPTTVAVTGERSDIDITLLPREHISGRIVDETGQPVPSSVKVIAYLRDGDTWAPLPLRGTDHATNRFDVADLVPGEYRLRIEPKPHIAPPRWWPDAATVDEASSIVLDRAEHHAGVVVKISTTAAVRGTVLTTEGAPAAVTVRLVAHDNDMSVERADLPSVRTDAQGRYVFPEVAAGGYRILFDADPPLADSWWPDAPGPQGASVMRVDDGDDVVADGTVPDGGSIVGQVRGRPGDPEVPSDLPVRHRLLRDNGTSWEVVSSDHRVVGQYPTNRIHITGLSAGRYRLELTEQLKKEHAPWWWRDGIDRATATDIVVGTGEAVDLGVLRPPEPAGLSGVVTDRQGTPVTERRVSLVRDWTYRQTADSIQTLTGPDGRFTFQGLDPGDYRLSVQSDERLAGQWWPDATERDNASVIRLASGEHRRDLDVALHDRSTVAGTVRDDRGLPVSDARVDVLDVNEHILRSATTDSLGQYEVPGLHPGTVWVRARRAGHLSAFHPAGPDLESGDPVVVEQGRDASEVDVDLVRTGGLSGRVTYTRPSDHVFQYDKVQLYRLDPSGVGWTELGRASLPDDGTFAYAGLEPGYYTVRYDAPNHRAQYFGGAFQVSDAQVVHVRPGEQVPGVDAVLRPATGSISGSVLDRSAAPGNRWLSLYLLDGEEWIRAFPEPYRFDVHGEFVFRELPAGRYRLQIGRPPYRTDGWWDNASFDGSTVIEVEDDEAVTGIDVVIGARPTITGTVTDAAGAPVRGFQVGAVDRIGHLDTQTDAHGRYELEVRPGPQRVYFGSTQGPRVRTWWPHGAAEEDAEPVHAVEDRAVRGIDHVVAEGSTLSGTVTTPAGEPWTGTVRVTSPAGATGTAVVAPDGTFAVNGLADGYYQLSVDTVPREYWPSTHDPTAAQYVAVSGGRETEVEVVVTGAERTVRALDGPTLSGVPAIGSTLVVDPGSWSEAETRFDYRWYVGGRLVPEAHGPSYEVAVADAGLRVRAEVVGRHPERLATAARTRETAPVDPETTPSVDNQRLPVVVGDPRVGTVLEAEEGAWIPSLVTFDHQWLRDGVPIPGATDPTYRVAADDRGHQLSVRVIGSSPGRDTQTVTSGPTHTVLDPFLRATSPPSIGAGRPVEGQDLAGHPGRWTSEEVTFAYQWFYVYYTWDYPDPENAVPIAGATKPTFRPTSDLIGHQLLLRVVARDSSREPRIAWSAPTESVRVAAMRVTARPRVNGTTKVRGYVYAGLGRYSPTPDQHQFQWISGGRRIPGATTSYYIPRRADLGRRLQVRVVAIGDGVRVVAFSPPSRRVTRH